MEEIKANIKEPYYPLISCIMPTAGRAYCMPQAVGYFMAQDYPNKELVIVYNTDADLPQGWAAYPQYYLPLNVRLVRVATKIIGAKRNEACRAAQGAIIAQWDDDDIYNTNRLSVQAAPILAGEANITGLDNFVFYEAPTGQAWLPTPMLHADIFVAGVHGGSLVYDKRIWEYLSAYPNMATGEDAWFLRRVMKKGAVVKAIDGMELFVYVRHNSNTWKFEKDNFRRYDGWVNVPVPQWAADYVQFYKKAALYQQTLKTSTRRSAVSVSRHV